MWYHAGSYDTTIIGSIIQTQNHSLIVVQENKLNFINSYNSPIEMLSKQYSLSLFWKSSPGFPGLSLVAMASDYFYSTS